jgi:hypothetical protein
MDDLRERFLRNVRFASGGMGNPDAFEGPMPEYFGGRAQQENIKGLLGIGTSMGLGALAVPAPEAAPVLLPAAGLGAMGALGNLSDAAGYMDASNMWKNTGLPQRPSMDEGHMEDAIGRAAVGAGAGAVSPAVVRALMNRR